MAYNKFITKDGVVFLDLTNATEIPSNKLEKGYVAYDRRGYRIEGTGEHLLQEKTVSENGEVAPDDGYYGLSKVTVDVSENNAESMEFNIAYGETPPATIDKLWVNAAKPTLVSITPKIEVKPEGLELGITALPAKAGEIAHIKAGNKIYLFGGGKNSKLNTINSFNLEDNKITTLSTKLPDYASGIAAAAVDTKIYLFGGEGGTSYAGSMLIDTINVFDVEANTITTLDKKLPVAANGITAVAVDKNIYLFGGKKTYAGEKLNTILLFNTEHNTLIELDTKLPNGACRMGCAKIGPKIYLFGGDGVGSNPTANIYVFDTDTNSISTLSTKLPKAVEGLGVTNIGTKVFLFGGSDNSPLNTISIFDTETELYTTLDTKLPEKLSDIAVCGVGTKIYLFGGRTSSSGSDAVNVFNTSMALEPNTLLFETSQDKNIIELLPHIKLGINSAYLGNAEGQGEKINVYTGKNIIKYSYENYYTSSAFGLGDTDTDINTTLTAVVNCSIGDLVVAAIATRDALTLDGDWTLVSTSELNSIDTTKQRISWAYKFAESKTESITVTQASAQRLYINMIAIPGATGVIDHGYLYDNSGTTGKITANKPAGLVLWGLSAATWGTTAPYKIWSSSSPEMPIVQLGPNSASRLGMALDQSTASTVTFSGSAAEHKGLTVGCLGIQGIDKFYTATSYTENVWSEI